MRSLMDYTSRITIVFRMHSGRYIHTRVQNLRMRLYIVSSAYCASSTSLTPRHRRFWLRLKFTAQSIYFILFIPPPCWSLLTWKPARARPCVHQPVSPSQYRGAYVESIIQDVINETAKYISSAIEIVRRRTRSESARIRKRYSFVGRTITAHLSGKRDRGERMSRWGKRREIGERRKRLPQRGEQERQRQL